MKRNWRIKENYINKGLEEYSKSPVLAKLLANRGIEKKEDIEEFLNPKNISLISPFSYSDMEFAVNRIKKAIDNNEKILIWGDFDADGVTSTSLLYRVFKRLNANFLHFIPNRKDMGHGLNSGELLKFISKEKIKLVITVDCGISNIKEAELLKTFNVDLIITDHHKDSEILPPAVAIINANAKDKISENLSLKEIKSLSNLAGVGVSYKLFCALTKHYPELLELNEKLLCLACVGTISDVVPLVGENRTLVALGLEYINSGIYPAISKLFKECGREGEIKSYDIAFVLTPRINAMGRLADVGAPLELLIRDDVENLTPVIETLNSYNKTRQELCDEMLSSVKDFAKNDKNPAIIMYNKNWHIGIIGIVASGIVEVTNKPTFLMTKGEDGTIRCSARGPKGFSIYEIMNKTKDKFLGFGGHAGAGGFSFNPDEFSFDDVKNALLNSFNELYDGIKADFALEIECVLNEDDINEDLIGDIELLEPFGEANPAPLFCLKNVNYLTHKFVGKEANHLKLECTLGNSHLHCVWWGKDSFSISSKPFDIAFAPKINEFMGNKTIQLELADVSLDDIDEIKIYDHRMKENILSQINEYLGRDGIFAQVWVKNHKTFEKIKCYENIFKRSMETKEDNDSIMFFDYPSSPEKLKEILKNNYKKIHLLKEEFEYDIKQILKSLCGMIKYSTNKKQGEIDLEKMSQALGVSYDFVQASFEIFEKEGFIKILKENKIELLSQPIFEKVQNNTMFEILEDELNNISNFKNTLMELSIEQFKEQFL